METECECDVVYEAGYEGGWMLTEEKYLERLNCEMKYESFDILQWMRNMTFYKYCPFCGKKLDNIELKTLYIVMDYKFKMGLK